MSRLRERERRRERTRYESLYSCSMCDSHILKKKLVVSRRSFFICAAIFGLMFLSSDRNQANAELWAEQRCICGSNSKPRPIRLSVASDSKSEKLNFCNSVSLAAHDMIAMSFRSVSLRPTVRANGSNNLRRFVSHETENEWNCHSLWTVISDQVDRCTLITAGPIVWRRIRSIYIARLQFNSIQQKRMPPASTRA